MSDRDGAHTFDSCNQGLRAHGHVRAAPIDNTIDGLENALIMIM